MEKSFSQQSWTCSLGTESPRWEQRCSPTTSLTEWVPAAGHQLWGFWFNMMQHQQQSPATVSTGSVRWIQVLDFGPYGYSNLHKATWMEKAWSPASKMARACSHHHAKLFPLNERPNRGPTGLLPLGALLAGHKCMLCTYAQRCLGRKTFALALAPQLIQCDNLTLIVNKTMQKMWKCINIWIKYNMLLNEQQM